MFENTSLRFFLRLPHPPLSFFLSSSHPPQTTKDTAHLPTTIFTHPFCIYQHNPSPTSPRYHSRCRSTSLAITMPPSDWPQLLIWLPSELPSSNSLTNLYTAVRIQVQARPVLSSRYVKHFSSSQMGCLVLERVTESCFVFFFRSWPSPLRHSPTRAKEPDTMPNALRPSGLMTTTTNGPLST